jgi:hypothetical protein
MALGQKGGLLKGTDGGGGGGLTTASNGLTAVGSDVILGGTLDVNTSIDGNSKWIELGTSSSKLSGLYINADDYTSEVVDTPGLVYSLVSQTPYYFNVKVESDPNIGEIKLNATETQLRSNNSYLTLNENTLDLQTNGSGFLAKLQTSLLTTDQIFDFPNNSGTIALESSLGNCVQKLTNNTLFDFSLNALDITSDNGNYLQSYIGLASTSLSVGFQTNSITFNSLGTSILTDTGNKISFNTGSAFSVLVETTNILTLDRTFQFPDISGQLQTQNSTATISGVKTFNAGTLVTGPNTASNASHVFTPIGSVLKTTPTAGDLEVDANGQMYYTHNTSNRGVVHTEQWISLTTPYILTSQTAAQKLFNSTTNGALNVKAATTYFFECYYDLSAMSAVSGSFGFALGGTATITSQKWNTEAKKAILTTPATNQVTAGNIGPNLAITPSTTTTVGYAKISGVVRINTAGTLIPQVSLGVAAAAIVGVNSYFRIIPVGTNTTTNVGGWN